MTVKLNFVMIQQRVELLPVQVSEQLQADMENRVNKDTVQYEILWSGDREWVMDEVVSEGPSGKCLNRWVNVIEEKGWEEEEK